MSEEVYRLQNQSESAICPRGHGHARARKEGKLKCEGCDCPVCKVGINVL
jgi:hypothetical protein